MILCENDSLVIRHETGEAIKEVLHRRVDAFEELWLPSVLSGDPIAVLKLLLKNEFLWLGATRKQELLNDTTLLTPEGLRGHFRSVLERECELNTASSPEARISFQRTLRIPDDGGIWPLPPGFGGLPVTPAARHSRRVPEAWLEADGMLVPVHQAEALWMNFSASWPTALKLGTGALNAVSGESWTSGLPRNPQGYVVLPGQPWLDGFATAPGVVRQFVATRIGDGYTAEEQVLGFGRGRSVP